MQNPWKNCPRCAERVKRGAQVCKWCSYEFTEADEADLKSQEAEEDANAKSCQNGCIGVFSVVVLAVLFLTMCGTASSDDQRFTGTKADSSDDEQFTVTKAETGDVWPYDSAETGVVRCEPGTRQVTIELNGKKFGLNGKAQGQGGFEPSQSLSGVDAYGIIKVAPGQWIERGLALCEY